MTPGTLAWTPAGQLVVVVDRVDAVVVLHGDDSVSVLRVEQLEPWTPQEDDR